MKRLSYNNSAYNNRPYCTAQVQAQDQTRTIKSQTRTLEKKHILEALLIFFKHVFYYRSRHLIFGLDIIITWSMKSNARSSWRSFATQNISTLASKSDNLIMHAKSIYNSLTLNI